MKWVIELDGSVHDDPEVAERDKQRENDLKAWGYEVIRFRNEQIHTDIESVIRTIEIKSMEFLKPSKSP